MSKLVRSLGVAALVLAVTGAALAATVQENRSETMKKNLANLKPFVAVSKGKAEPSPALVANANALEQVSKTLLTLFPKDSTSDTSRAKPEIWANWADFELKVAAFQNAVPGLIAAAKSGDKAEIGAATKAVGGACGGCHKLYRKPMKK